MDLKKPRRDAVNDAEFPDFLENSVRDYAAEKVAAGLWSQAESLGLARKACTQLTVGLIWIAVQDRAGKRIAYVYDVNVKPQHQRKGYATQAFLALEEEVRRLGLSGIALNVFGHNVGAQALYRKLGYRPITISLFKEVGATARDAKGPTAI